MRKGTMAYPAGAIDVRATETSEEWALIKHLARFPEAVRDATRAYQPHVVANYLYHLAQTFHAFYHQVPVLQATDEALRQSRMELVRATAQVMQTGLGLLGIQVPERM
jgi:arginyl-tRNA synthetase